MGKDKIIVTVRIFLLFLPIYLGYLVYDHNNQGNNWIEEFGLTKKNEASDLNLSALLLGGSNVVYSLSASQLDKLTELSWYNLGLSSEAFNDSNYWDYISNLLSEDRRKKIKLIVYSSAGLMRNGHIRKRSLEKSDAWGKRQFSWIPNVTLAVRLRDLVMQKPKIRKYPLPVEKGDFDFDFEKKICEQNYSEVFEREMNWADIESWVLLQSNEMLKLFPEAIIIFTVPSEYYGNKYDEEFDKSFFKKVKAYIQSKYKNRIKFFVQPAYSDKNITCDVGLHANSEGRYWRTKNLSDFIDSLNINNG